MKLEFPHFGGPSGASLPLPRRLIERRMRRLDVRPLDDAGSAIRFGLIGAAVFLGLFLLFAAFVPISGAAVASGEVSVSGSKVVIQPASSGIVGEMLVHEGQMVNAGQPLVRLNGVKSGAQLKQAQARRDALRATEARLLAERDGRATLTFPADLTARWNEPAVRDAMTAQRAMFDKHRSLLSADEDISTSQVASARARAAASAQQLALIRDELADYRMLFAKGFARKTTIRSLERNEAQLEADVAASQAAVREAELSLRKTTDGQQMSTVSELKSVQDQLAQVSPQLDVTRYYADLDVMRAPVAGRVSGVADVGAGMVISGGKTLMEIVPNGRAMIVDVQIAPDDIDDVRLGQEATVRFSTVNPHGQSTFTGRVVTLSPARVGSEGGGAGYYKAQITLDNPAILQKAGVELQPGIPASVNIKTHDRTLLDYLFSPFSDAMSKSFREE
ncbi:HlyD family type I secretion periplasmic adaptor subunit [Sphingomonas xinjiangensis]|uniref:Membrane fusion protein (MFP) family protein n=1 Tax=Sphingomonas xinjiangensis TaxID=643568 RepID=A0A840YPY9_9SPHN|nr:HlyD family type I secretion periplasmic adaptor subunit [Sphingomonas xinjiangensis]MBB5709883.1 HlyD family type I secretion membrane fusion protein [Sphingomonas xinjiangensis]